MSDGSLVVVIDDHESVRDSLRALLESSGLRVKDYASAVAYLEDGSKVHVRAIPAAATP